MSQHTIGYTGIVRRGHALRPGSSNDVKLEDITEPCPTCGEPAVRQSYDSIRPDGVYRVTQLRCPHAKIRRDTKRGSQDFRDLSKVTCPIHKTEIKIGDPTMPVQKICTILPKEADLEEYKRLKAALGIHNKEFCKLCLLANAAVYDWFAGRPISQPTEAKILHAIKELQKREAACQSVESSQGAPQPEEAPAGVVTPTAPLTDPDLAPTEPEDIKCGQTQPKWIAALRKLADTVDPMTTAVQNLELRTAVLEGRAAEAAETSANLRQDLATWVNHTGATLRGHHISMEQLERGQEPIGAIQEQLDSLRDVSIRLSCIEAEVNTLAKFLNNYDAELSRVISRIDEIEEDANAEPDITDEQLERIQFNPPCNQAAKANLCVELLTPMSPVLISCIWEVVKANRLLAQAVAK